MTVTGVDTDVETLTLTADFDAPLERVWPMGADPRQLERTRMELHSTFDSKEQMEQLVSMGMAEGLREAVGQMDTLLAG